MQVSLELVKLTIGPGATDDKQTPWKRPVLPYAIVRCGRSVRYITVAKAGSKPYNKSRGGWFYANYKEWSRQDQTQEDKEFTWEETVKLDINNEVTNITVEVYNFRFREMDAKMGSFQIPVSAAVDGRLISRELSEDGKTGRVDAKLCLALSIPKFYVQNNR